MGCIENHIANSFFPFLRNVNFLSVLINVNTPPIFSKKNIEILIKFK